MLFGIVFPTSAGAQNALACAEARASYRDGFEHLSDYRRGFRKQAQLARDPTYPEGLRDEARSRAGSAYLDFDMMLDAIKPRLRLLRKLQCEPLAVLNGYDQQLADSRAGALRKPGT